MGKKLFDSSNITLLRTEHEIEAYINRTIEKLDEDKRLNFQESITKAVNNLFKGLDFVPVLGGKIVNMENEREIVLRLFTFHALLYILENRLKQNQSFSEACEFAGIIIGREFSHTILSTLIAEEKLITYKGYLALWKKYETRAGWGAIELVDYDENKQEVIVLFKEPISSYKDALSSVDNVNSFLKGYILGVVDEGFRVLDFLGDKTRYIRVSSNSYSVKEVKAKMNNAIHGLELTVFLEPTKMRNAFNQLHEYKFLQENKSILQLRIAIEFAVKELLDIEKSSYQSVQKMLKMLSQSDQKGIDFSAAHDLYQDLSDVTHRGEVAEENANEYYLRTKYFLSELAFYNLSNRNKKGIKNKLENYPIRQEHELNTDKFEDFFSSTKGKKYSAEEKNNLNTNIGRLLLEAKKQIDVNEQKQVLIHEEESKLEAGKFLDVEKSNMLSESKSRIEYLKNVIINLEKLQKDFSDDGD